MGQILHGSATTTHAIRAAIQRSKASIQALSERVLSHDWIDGPRGGGIALCDIPSRS